MKLSRIGLLLALPACAASGLSPSIAWAGKFARAAERIHAVVPESLKPANEPPTAGPTSAGLPAPQATAIPPAGAAPAAEIDPAAPFAITVAPAHTAHDEGLTTQKLIDAANLGPAPDDLSAPEAAATSVAPSAFAPATATARRNVPTLAPPLAPPQFPTARPTPAGSEPNLLPANEPVANGPDSEGLESLAHKRAVAGPGVAGAATPPAEATQPAAAPTAAAPQLLTPGTNSDGLRPMLVAPGGPTRAPEHAIGHNELRDANASGASTYRNVLREGSIGGDVASSEENGGVEQTAGRQRGRGLPTVVSAAANPAAAGTSTVGPSIAGQAAAPTTVAEKSAPVAPQTIAPALSAPAGSSQATSIPSGTAQVANPSTSRAPLASPAPSTSPTSSAVTSPRASSSAAPSRGAAVVTDDREPGSLDRKSVIGKQPADKKSQQMFESEDQPQALTTELELLRKRVQTALAHYYQNWTLNTREHSPWEVMHAIVAYGVDTRLQKGGPNGERMTAIGHLCFSGICNNQPILTIRNGKLYALRGPGVQGHSGQFLAILAQSYLQRDYPLYVGGEKYTLEDLIKAEQEDCESGTELTFKLIALMHYLPSDATWTNFQGQTWSLDRLVREEIVQQVRGAACGGTHRLMGLSYAIRKREQRGEPITGIYLEARKYIDQYHKYTFSLQNRDGSFSTAWFVRPEARNDLDRRMQTTGHILEWLCFSLSDEQLRDPRVVKSVRYITDLLLNQSVNEWEIGHLGHALHALQIYNERVFGGPVRSFEGLVRRPTKTARAPSMGTGGMSTVR